MKEYNIEAILIIVRFVEACGGLDRLKEIMEEAKNISPTPRKKIEKLNYYNQRIIDNSEDKLIKKDIGAYIRNFMRNINSLTKKINELVDIINEEGK